MFFFLQFSSNQFSPLCLLDLTLGYKGLLIFFCYFHRLIFTFKSYFHLEFYLGVYVVYVYVYVESQFYLAPHPRHPDRATSYSNSTYLNFPSSDLRCHLYQVLYDIGIWVFFWTIYSVSFIYVPVTINFNK